LTPRPVIYVLAGVNGAGKSSIGGHLLARALLSWFNPDTFARELVSLTGCTQDSANAAAWQEGMRRFDLAIANCKSFAFETTLGGRSVAARLHAATASHDVLMWFCGLATAELHIARVGARVLAGGHDIPQAKIRERYPAALQNLIQLMRHLTRLQVYDNSAQAEPGTPIENPLLVLEMRAGQLSRPIHLEDLKRTPHWAKPVVEAALRAV